MRGFYFAFAVETTRRRGGRCFKPPAPPLLKKSAIPLTSAIRKEMLPMVEDYPYELWPLLIELDDGWLVEWFTGELAPEGQA